jgi:hypothetical protein
MTMAGDGTAFATIAETTIFLNYFNDLPDYRQAGKVDYPLPEVLLLILLAVLARGRKRSPISRGLARRSSTCCGGSCPL